MPAAPLAYFLTFSTYGTRLHGDSRGTVDRHHNALGSPPLRRDDFRSGFEQRNMAAPQFELTPSMRTLLELTFESVSAFRNWTLLAQNVRGTHIHIVVASTDPVDRVLQTLKSYGTRALREARLIDSDAPVWARHGSTRYLWKDTDLQAAVDYTMNRQGKDMPGSEWLLRNRIEPEGPER